jgi:hypothetical protein
LRSDTQGITPLAIEYQTLRMRRIFPVSAGTARAKPSSGRSSSSTNASTTRAGSVLGRCPRSQAAGVFDADPSPRRNASYRSRIGRNHHVEMLSRTLDPPASFARQVRLPESGHFADGTRPSKPRCTNAVASPTTPIWGQPLVAQPHASRQTIFLPENIDWNSASRIPIAANA